MAQDGRVGATLEVTPPATGGITRRAALVELSFFLALVFSFIWIWSRAFPHAALVVYVVGLGFTLATHVIHRETAEQIGLRLDNLIPAAMQAAVPVVPLAAVFFVTGLTREEWHLEALDPDRFLRLTAWGFLQQYLLQGFIHRRVAALIARQGPRELTVAAIFAALHLPNPLLLPVTFLAGYVFSVLYRRCPNLLVLALCHAIGSTAVAFAFGPENLRKMRVGPGYFRA